jgi:hypothetical protein
MLETDKGRAPAFPALLLLVNFNQELQKTYCSFRERHHDIAVIKGPND